MGLSLRCFLLLSLLTLTAGADFLDLNKASGRTFFRDSNRAKGSAAAGWDHSVRKRSAQPDASCDALQGFEAKLENNTHRHTFNDLSGSVLLAWVGDGTGVILALTTFHVPIFMINLGQSKLYRSEDYGKTFLDVTKLINNTFIRSEFGIAIGPENSGKVILTGEVSGGHRSRIFVSSDFGKSFTHLELPFNPTSAITYNPENSDVLLGLSNKRELWLTKDFGHNWIKIHNMVCMVKWGTKNAIFFLTNRNGSCNARGALEIRRTTDFGQNIKTVANKIYSFGLGGRFLFASVMTGEATQRRIHVSVDQGDTWNMAQLPSIGSDQFYSILGASNDMVFMHVDEPEDDGVGTIYVSDDRGTVFSKSLERHLYTTTGGESDFTNITSLRGVFITSTLTEDKSVRSVMTRNMGGEWTPLRKPTISNCDSKGKRPEECALHILATYSTAMRLNVPMLPLSEPNAVGLILAHGSIGNDVSVMTPDVFVSDDGGYTWMKALDGPHHYAILDSGGLLVAVEHSPDEPVDEIKFSTDEGQCWHTYKFTEEPIFFTGLASEPGARSMNVSIWGYKTSILNQHWVSTTIDFRDLITRDCVTRDYVQWLSHSDNISDPSNGCILGYRETFRRLRKDSVCWNGRDYLVSTELTPCPCTLYDFLCDFGYYRKENSAECVEEPDLQGKMLEFCLHGREEQLRTQGYRKIPGDKCEGGTIPERKEIDLSVRCVSDLLGPDMQQKKGNSTTSVAIVLTIVIMLLSVAAGVLFIKKYVCGGRFLVHRYSVLQQQANENAAEGVDNTLDDQLDSEHGVNGKIDFHDDSDEDLLQ
ncbi:sortilin 1b isoform X1 [Hippocampus comes]|uniref:Sortilin 1a n=1 Tax=Hippocampus comes TaxID=109280 RepID=A0A3Q2XDZ8_HIPCM|nr:PREDICTED: sortilin-like isoform X1 [Hippocampus comes]XP_019716253.1 PREDICTED: sortilin-like isoform X1 [Hippocampus comes]